MPFLRVLRDKRGYETTYLMHWFRDGNRQRSKILYMFRTPPGVRVGCDVLDPAVVRDIEAQHPDIEFDWRALFDNRQVVESAPEPRQQRGQRGSRAEPPEPRKRRREEPAPPPPPEVVQPPPPVTAVAEPPAAAETPKERFRVPEGIEGTTREEQIAFVAKWYVGIRDRIPHRTHDPVRRETLLQLVERLNPSPWGNEEQVVVGLEHAAEALHRLSRVFSKRRRRTRRPKPPGADTGAPNEPA
jgi:hypothetical protein